MRVQISVKGWPLSDLNLSYGTHLLNKMFFFFACSQMIEISSLTTTACRNCDNALSLDYYEMLMLKKDVETEMMEVLELLCEITPVVKPDLGCQFPNHEKLLANIRSCAKLVLRKYLGL